MKQLLDQGADINGLAEGVGTPLHVAIVRNDVELAKILIDRGANVNTLDQDKESPLHCAVTFVDSSDTPMIRLLLSHGANTRVKNNRGFTPGALAKANSKKVISPFKEYSMCAANLINSLKK